jgi:hypothetical protein
VFSEAQWKGLGGYSWLNFSFFSTERAVNFNEDEQKNFWKVHACYLVLIWYEILCLPLLWPETNTQILYCRNISDLCRIESIGLHMCKR